MKGETTNPELLRSLREADSTEAWLRFEQTYRPRILRHCRSVGLTLDQSDEVIQECFIKCFRYLPSFDYTNDAARAWSVNDALYWVREYGIDGLRLDAIKHVPRTWLTDLRARLSRDVTPAMGSRFYLVGETLKLLNQEREKAEAGRG